MIHACIFMTTKTLEIGCEWAHPCKTNDVIYTCDDVALRFGHPSLKLEKLEVYKRIIPENAINCVPKCYL